MECTSKSITPDTVLDYLNGFGYHIPLCDNMLKKLVSVFHALRILVISDQLERRNIFPLRKPNFTETIASLLCIATNGKCRVNYFEKEDIRNFDIGKNFTALVTRLHNKDYHHNLEIAIMSFNNNCRFGEDFYDIDKDIIEKLREKPKALKYNPLVIRQANHIVTILDEYKNQ